MPGYGRASLRGRDLVLKDRGAEVRDALVATAAVWVLALALWLDVRFMGGILGRISTEAMNVHGDFDTFWRSARAFWESREVYATGADLENLNPPFWILLISPFGLLEPLVAYRFFVLITLSITVAYLAWVADELRLRPAWAVIGGVMLILSSPLLATLALGQIYPMLAFGLVVAWMADRLRWCTWARGGDQTDARPCATLAARAAAVGRVLGGDSGRGGGDARRGRRGWVRGDARLVEAAH